MSTSSTLTCIAHVPGSVSGTALAAGEFAAKNHVEVAEVVMSELPHSKHEIRRKSQARKQGKRADRGPFSPWDFEIPSDFVLLMRETMTVVADDEFSDFYAGQ